MNRYTAATIVAVTITVALVALYALGANDAVEEWVERVAAVLGPVVTAYLTKDSDHNGVPDFLEGDDR